MFRSARHLLAAAAMLMLLAGCNGDDDAPTAGDSPASGSMAPVVAPAAGTVTSLLTGLRVTHHDGFDRVVLQFRNAVPGYRIGYVERPVLADGSGAEIPVAGARVVVIRMAPALDADLSQESAPRTYSGPRRFSPGTPEVTELVRVGGFEGVLTWAVGLAAPVAFRAGTLADPPRLVVDFGS